MPNPLPLQITGLGEILWDLLPSGPQLGGAPANFAYHAHVLGAQSHIISRIGQDPLATQTLTKLAQLGLNTTGIQIDPDLPTGTVAVKIDPNGQPQYSIHHPVAWDAMFELKGTPEDQLRQLAINYQLQCVALTRGAHGSLLLTDAEIDDHPGIPTQIGDTIGAGDAFTAALTIGLLSKHSLNQINHNANTLASYVASQRGATPRLPAKLLTQL